MASETKSANHRLEFDCPGYPEALLDPARQHGLYGSLTR